MKISICIPTYNRAPHLRNCLNSIILNRLGQNVDFEVCISDNCSTDETEDVVRWAGKSININYQKNIKNLGLAKNFLNVVEMATGEFVWMIGDDDLLLPNALTDIYSLLCENNSVDYFFINSFCLTSEQILSFPQPFDTSNLPKNMKAWSSFTNSRKVSFLDLIDPKISFDFLGAIFLSVFRRKNWIENTNVLDSQALDDSNVFSHYDNTFPHVKIFAKAFSNSKAYFYSKPLSVCLSGVREWFALSPLVKSVRLLESLKEYRKNGLPLLRYVMCKNKALNSFAPDFVRMILDKKRSGYAYINPLKLIVGNLLYPGFYISFFAPFLKKSIWKRIFHLTDSPIESSSHD